MLVYSENCAVLHYLSVFSLCWTPALHGNFARAVVLVYSENCAVLHYLSVFSLCWTPALHGNFARAVVLVNSEMCLLLTVFTWLCLLLAMLTMRPEL